MFSRLFRSSSRVAQAAANRRVFSTMAPQASRTLSHASMLALSGATFTASLLYTLNRDRLAAEAAPAAAAAIDPSKRRNDEYTCAYNDPR